jgi:microcystin degradation protein MlrC
MRILLTGFSHETNTFVPRPTGLDEFEANGIYQEDQMLELAGTNTIPGGVFEELPLWEGVEIIPVLDMSAIPGGLVTAESLDFFLSKSVEAINASSPDAIILDLHGAMVAEGHDDGDAEIIQRVRDAAGPNVPIISTLDLHANVSDGMLLDGTVLIPFDTYPHVDMAERGREALRVAVSAAKKTTKPTMRHRKLPMMLAGQKQYSHVEPTLSIMALVHEVEDRPGVITAGVCFAFPWADCPFPGMTVTVVTDNDEHLADSYAEEIAQFIWNRREEFRPNVYTVEEAIHHAMQAENGPVTLADIGDNPGGGSAADGTSLLWGLLDLGANNAAFALICDPEVVDAAFEAGIGGELKVELGGKTDDLHGHPIPVSATIQNLTDGSFVYEGPMMQGVENTLGRTAVLACKGRHGAIVEVIVTERRCQPLDAAVFRSQGIEPTEKHILGVKSAVHFRASFTPISAEILDVDTPGLTSIDFSRFPYDRLARPIWPLDHL